MFTILLSPKHVSELIWVPPLSSDHFLPLGIIRELNLSVVYYYHKHQCHYALSQLPMMPGDAHYKAEHKKLTLPQQYSRVPTLPGRKGVGNHSHLLAPPNMAHILQVNCHSNPSEQPWWLFLFTEQERSRAVSSLLRHLGLWQWPSGFKTHAENSPPLLSSTEAALTQYAVPTETPHQRLMLLDNLCKADLSITTRLNSSSLGHWLCCLYVL